MRVNIDLSKRYASAFGLLSQDNAPGGATVQRSGGNYNLEFYDRGPADFEDVTFTYPDRTIKFGAMPFDTEVAGILAPPPLISFSRQKQLIETPINDSDNIVIERWGTRPHDIRIRGLLIDVENRHYPSSKVEQLYRLFEYNGVIDVSGTQFFEKNIASIYYKDIEVNGVPGFQDTVQFTMLARSISPVGFTLTNPI
ncbi:DUF6046 domain-containing protein [Aquimarina latercula]|uniref:DUF6046 domain-containing protein n=1 Tax=Aquimarina latercula TaxID=987 RepID=UPI00138AF549|nr:DUF6046 domain-containing protein [Aquimarina latercula]